MGFVLNYFNDMKVCQANPVIVWAYVVYLIAYSTAEAVLQKMDDMQKMRRRVRNRDRDTTEEVNVCMCVCVCLPHLLYSMQ